MGEGRMQGPVTLSSVKGRPLGMEVVPAGPSGCPPPTNPSAPFFLPCLGQLVQREEPSAGRGGMGESISIPHLRVGTYHLCLFQAIL